LKELIQGINPFFISKIIATRFKRYGQWHPYYLKLHQRKWKFLAWRNNGTSIGAYPATVKIIGPNGNPLKVIRCKSNECATTLAKECITQLEQHLSSRGQHTSHIYKGI